MGVNIGCVVVLDVDVVVDVDFVDFCSVNLILFWLCYFFEHWFVTNYSVLCLLMVGDAY